MSGEQMSSVCKCHTSVLSPQERLNGITNGLPGLRPLFWWGAQCTSHNNLLFIRLFFSSPCYRPTLLSNRIFCLFFFLFNKIKGLEAKAHYFSIGRPWQGTSETPAEALSHVFCALRHRPIPIIHLSRSHYIAFELPCDSEVWLNYSPCMFLLPLL